MKEKVDRILNGEAVDIAGDGADYYLSVSKYDDKYKVGFVNPNYVEEYFTCLNTKTMRDAGNKLIELADELESRKRFKEGGGTNFALSDRMGKYEKLFSFPMMHIIVVCLCRGTLLKRKRKPKQTRTLF